MFRSITPAVRAIILTNVVIFLIEQVALDPLLRYGALWPIGPAFRPWQLVTYAFLHGGTSSPSFNLMHIFFNMFALYIFGPALEQFWGARRFLAFYFVQLTFDIAVIFGLNFHLLGYL